jgi:putative two-component system response regulator
MITERRNDVETVLFTLARVVEARDPYTGDHCDRLRHMAGALGRELRLEQAGLETLQRGTVLHDIGKIGIPDQVLMKQDRLTSEERRIMEKHVVIGAALLKPLASMRDTLPIVECHHEKWNGTGYPNGLAGEEIPLLARAFQVVDVFDALTSERPYKKALSYEESLVLMKEEVASGFWDPEIFEAFSGIVRRRPQHLKKVPVRKEQKLAREIFDLGYGRFIKKTGVKQN